MILKILVAYASIENYFQTQRIACSGSVSAGVFVQIPPASLITNRIAANKPPQLRVEVPVSILIQSRLGIEASAGVGIGMARTIYLVRGCTAPIRGGIASVLALSIPRTSADP